MMFSSIQAKKPGKPHGSPGFFCLVLNVSSDRVRAAFSGSDPYGVVHGDDEDLAVTHLPCPGNLLDCLEKTCVSTDNGGSDFYSIVELRSKDKPGLLYAIARGLQKAGLDVAFAKIATHKDQVQDIFYVQDAGGQKIVDDDEIAALRESLMQSLE